MTKKFILIEVFLKLKTLLLLYKEDKSKLNSGHPFKKA